MTSVRCASSRRMFWVAMAIRAASSVGTLSTSS